MKKALVVYYSLDGNTKAAAEEISEKLSCDSEEIRLVKPMPKSNFARFIVGGGQATLKKIVPIKPLEHTPKNYDCIVIGTPVWAGKPSSPIMSFIDGCSQKEKIIAAFSSSAGGDNGKCVAALRKKLPSIVLDCALGDRRGKYADRNTENISSFIEALRKFLNTDQ
jgi:flavodoxin